MYARSALADINKTIAVQKASVGNKYNDPSLSQSSIPIINHVEKKNNI